MAATITDSATQDFFRTSWKDESILKQKGYGMKRFLTLLTVLLLLLAPIGCARQTDSASDAAQSADAATEQPTASAPAADLGVAVTTFDELAAALADATVTRAHISADLEIDPKKEQTFEREGFLLTIDKGVVVTIRDNFVPVFFGKEDAPGWVNFGTIQILGTLNFGAMTLQNEGTLKVLGGGILCPGMSTIMNNGTIQIDKDGVIRLERGTALQNNGIITNFGKIQITSDGGSLINAASGKLENNAVIVFDGDYQNEGVYAGEQPEP